MSKHLAKPLEFSFASEAFNLAIEGTEDGERIQREIDAIKRAKEEAEKKQLSLCDHNQMVVNGTGWKCAKCGYVYGSA